MGAYSNRQDLADALVSTVKQLRHSRSGRLRTRFTDFPHSVDMHTWTNQIGRMEAPWRSERAKQPVRFLDAWAAARLNSGTVGRS